MTTADGSVRRLDGDAARLRVTDERIRTLEVLRGAAAWMVVFHHYMQLVHDSHGTTVLGRLFARHGPYGVHLFFVLSGFVMCLVISKRQPTAGTFLRRRVERILPAYWFFTFLAVVLTWVVPDAIWWTSWTWDTLLASLAFLPSQNPSGIGSVPLVTVGWTLNYEIFFYFLLAGILLFTRRMAIPVACIALYLLPRVWRTAYPLGEIASNQRLREFALGILIGGCFIYVRSAFARLGAIGGLCCMGAGCMLIDRSALSAGLVIVGALCMESNEAVRTRIPRFLLHLGDISYSTYLAHSFVIGALLLAFGRPATPGRDIALCIAVAAGVWLVSVLSYRYIERLPATLAGFVARRRQGRNESGRESEPRTVAVHPPGRGNSGQVVEPHPLQTIQRTDGV